MGRHTVDDQINAHRKELSKKFDEHTLDNLEGLIISWILKSKTREGISR